MSLDLEKLQISYSDPRFNIFRERILDVVEKVSEEELLAIATLLGAEFDFVAGTNGQDDWKIAKYRGKRIEFTERSSLHRSAAAFCIVANVFGDNP